MDRPRHRRRDPQRTGPIRNFGTVFRDEEPWRGTPLRDDAAADGVRNGYRVIEEQIRRGRRMAQTLDEKGWNDGPSQQERRRRPRYDEEDSRREGRGSFRFLETQMRRAERLTTEILRQMRTARPDPWRLAELVFRLYIESVSDLALLGFDAFGALAPRWGNRFDEDVDRIDRDIEENFDNLEEGFEELEEDARDWPAAPNVPTVIRSTVPIPVYVWSHERTEIDLELPAGAQSLDLVVEPALATGQPALPVVPALPAFAAELVALAGGPVILRIEVPRDLPAGRYRRRVLVRATGEPVGDLTVQVGAPPVAAVPTVPKKARKR